MLKSKLYRALCTLLCAGLLMSGCMEGVATIPVTGVTLDTEAVELVEGETMQLTATVSPFNATNQNVLWISSNSSVATVLDGVVTAVEAGSAKVTVKTDDGGKTAVCDVVVKSRDDDREAAALTWSVVAVTEVSATFAGRLDVPAEDLAFSKVTAYYSDTEVFNMNEALKASTAVFDEEGGFRIAVTGLRPDVKYGCCLVADVKSEKVYGDEMDFTTVALVAPTLNAASEIGLSSAIVSGNICLPSEATDDLEYGLQYSKSQDFTSGVMTKEVTDLGDEDDFSVKITSLASSTTYYYRSYISMSGATVNGEPKSFRTLTEDPNPPAGDVVTIAEFLERGGSAIEGVVISNTSLGNLTSKKTMYIQDETAGLQFYLAANHSFAFGDKVRVDVSGVSAGNYKGAVQVSGLALDKITKISSGNNVTPKTVTITDFLANKYEGQYVAIEGVQVAGSDLEKTFVMDGAHTKINMEDRHGKKFVVFSSKYATYGTRSVPKGSGTIKGISNINNGNMQIIFAQASDYAGLTDARWGSEDSSSANCYIVSAPGVYKFRTFKGNRREPVGAVVSAEVLWETFGTDVTPDVGDLVKNVSYRNDEITFQTADTFREGNALIAAKDASGEILWSWHIWFTDQPKEHKYIGTAGTMMDRNLGATSANRGDVGALGLLYQWGRKDPFLGSSSISSDTEAESTITWPSSIFSDSSTGTIAYATAHPTTYIVENNNNYDWYYSGTSSTNNSRWTNSGKTKSIYDPCPAGWRVPDSGRGSVWVLPFGELVSYDYSYDSTNMGMNFAGKLGFIGGPIWYPAAGRRLSNGPDCVGDFGQYWTVYTYGYKALCLYFNKYDEVYPQDVRRRAEGASVRCVKEE